ncbi:MAG: fibronectin type III domain-containing protein [Bacteroidales bacterium]|nr:fibronectin type III domain-containing protein [Bacteroidales bacterium]
MLLMTVFAPWATAQSLFSEDFEGGTMPTGWTTDGNGSWSIATAVNSSHPSTAGNGTYCAQITHGSTGDVTMLITPEIDLSSVTSAELSFMHVHQDWYGDNDELRVYYRTSSSGTWTLIDGQEYTAAYETWTTEEGITLPNLSSTYQIAFEYTDNYGFGLGIDYVQIVQGASCVKPNGLAATLTPGNGTIATLNWSAGATETAWVLEYGTASDFTGATSVNVSGTPTKNLTGLTAETLYYARVKADCGGGSVSNWSSTCEFTPTNALTITVADGTTTNGVIPLHSYSSDTQGSTGEFIIPASELASINGSDITNLKFYFSGTGYAWTNTFKVYMKEVTETTLSSVYGPAACTVVYTGTLDGSGTTLEIALDDAYTYGGGNLLIGTYMHTAGSYLGSANFYGIEATGAAYAYGTYNNGYDGVINFIPKTTLTYAAPPTCPKPTGLAYSNIDKRSVYLSWTEHGSATSWQICVNGDETNLVTANTNTNFLLEGLDPSTDYTVKVRAYCDDKDQSEWSVPVNFTTLLPCEAPTGFHAENITAFTADLKWTSTVGDYEVRYAPNTSTPELLQYDNGTLATSVGYGGAICWGVMYPAGSFTGNYLSTVTNYDVDDMDGNLFIYSGGTTAPGELIASKAITFTGVDDFVDITFDQLVPVDPSENLWIVFKQTSGADYPAAAAVDPGDANARWASLTGGDTWDDLANVGLPGYGWMIRANIETISLTGTGTSYTSNTYPLTGLTPKTKYAAQVRNVCGGIDGESAWVTTLFETLPSCTAPEGLAISGTVTARDAAFTWTAETSTLFQYCVIANPAPGYTPTNTDFANETTENTVTFTHALTPDTDYVFYLRKKCSDTDFSDIVSIAFKTDVACHAPTALSVANITKNSATLNWTGESGNYDVRYGLYPTSSAQETLSYGITQSSNLGGGTAAEITWGVKYPGSQITGNFLTGIVIPYVPSYNSNDYITLNVYIGGDNGPRNLVSTEVLHPEINGVNTLTLANPVALQAGENLWITLTETGTYVAPIGVSTEENAQWYFNGTEWTLWPFMVSNGYGCVIEGIMETLDLSAVAWTNATCIANTYDMSGLTPVTQYMAQVSHNCGGEDGESIWWTAQFTTDVACSVPTNLAVDNTTLTAHQATLSWDGDDPADYNVEYRTAEYTNGSTEDFSAAPTGWIFRTGALNTDGTATLTGTSSWSRGTNSGVFDAHMYMNLFSTKNYWLISPSMTIGDNDVLNFDLAYTKYSSGSTNSAPTTGCTTHRFAVLISTDEMATWTILREWNNSGSTYVLDNVSKNGQNSGAIDLSAYAKETAYIAFFGHSETSSYDNNMHFDNVTIGAAVPAGAWTAFSPSPTTNSVTLTGLTAETKYDVRVQMNCGSEGVSDWSDIVSFTTDLACPAPTGLAYANLKSDHVDLSWTTGGAEDWVVAYKADSDTDFTEVDVTSADVLQEGNLITYTLNGLTETTTYSVKVRDNCEASIAGDGTSEWTSAITFETLEACGQPTGLAASNIGHYSADLTWTGDSPEFIVQYRTAACVDGVEEAFPSSSIPSGWSQYTGLFNETEGTATLSSGSRWSFGTNNGVFDNHARTNNYSTYNAWLVTPSFTLPTGASFSFDVALTKYSGNNNAVDPTKQADDKFIVLISTNNKTTWTVLRKWDNAGSTYVYNELPATAAGLSVSDIDLSAYAGQTVCIAFYTESTNGEGNNGGDNNLHIDNVMIGNSIAAGAWQTLSPNPTTTTANLTGLTIGTKYDVTVAPDCDATLVSDVYTFTTVSENVKFFITEGNWDVTTNWEPAGAPTIEQDVQLKANVTIPSGCVAQAKSIAGTGTASNAYTLTINDGGQLKHNNSGVRATVKKQIDGYGSTNTNTNLGYYFISNPLYQTIYKHTSTSTPNISSTGILTGTYDFYNWSNADANVGQEWRNYEASNFDMSYGMYGYLYANEDDVELTFTGTLRASTNNDSRYLNNYSSTTNEFGGWNLVGNSFVCDAYLVSASTAGTALPYYKMNDDGDGFTAVSNGAPIAPVEGVFYEATATGSVYMVTTAPVPSTGKGNLNINMAQVATTRDMKPATDNAIVRFDGGQQLSKFNFRNGSSQVYIPQDGKDYAVVSAENEGEMPVCFKAETNGTYTLSFSTENVEFSYLHLIDNMTGNDVDLLETPSYTFDAQTTDYASRFRLVFATGTNDDSFAFISNGEIILNGVNGNTTVQVFDVTGRMINSTNGANRIATNNMAAGVYMLRLINGDNVKTQKIVVK